MASASLSARVAILEAEMLSLKAKLNTMSARPWTETVWGAFAGDEDFLDAMKQGRAYRASLQTKEKAHRNRRNGRS